MAVACQRMMKVMCRSALQITKALRVAPQAAGGTRFCKEEKTGRRAACEIDDKPYTLAGLAESTE
ncbi:hypothetical protein [Serratia marcescens]|uniref:hypothetical protein n=1 Tax=Serratia marcescens TaxID=615 RepID=UPI0015E15EF8|nr:hypothetical protein [Serratia marcescens]